MTNRDLEHRLLIACAVAREAGHLARDYFIRRDQLEVEHKGMQDLVSVADREVEELIRTRLGAAFPEDALLGEEGGGEGLADDLEEDAGRRRGGREPVAGCGSSTRSTAPRTSCAACPRSLGLGYLVDGQPTSQSPTIRCTTTVLGAAGCGRYRNERAMRVTDRDDPKEAVIGSTFTFKMKIEDYGG